jgi:hypothetical protein
MRKNKLILLEGIPGAGKSSAGMHIQAFLEKRGISSFFWREGDFDHPADFEGIACLSASVYQDFLSRYPQLAVLLDEYLTICGADHLLSYRKLQHNHPQALPPTLTDEFSRYDVYDGLSMSEYCRLALQRWQDFRQSVRNADAITLLECCLLQNPLTVLLARHNGTPSIARQQIGAVAAIIQDLKPLVIYLSPQNARTALEAVRAERPKEWADFVIAYLTRQAYGQTHHLDGFEGVIRFYEMRQKLEIDILRELPVQSLVIEHSGQEWERCYQQMEQFLNVHLST